MNLRHFIDFLNYIAIFIALNSLADISKRSVKSTKLL